jgi:acyl-coenzyme A thioesterase PaaI-like protein
MAALPDLSPFSKYLGMSPARPSPDGTHTLVSMPVVDGLCGTPGVLRAGVIGTLVDTAAGFRAIVDADPDWIATADMAIHCSGLQVHGSVTARATTVKKRRHALVIDTTVTDDTTGVLVAHSMLTFALLGEQRELAPEVQPHGELVASDEPSLARAGFTEPADRPEAVSVSIAGVLRNNSGGLVGGAIAALADAAACRAVGEGSEVGELGVWFLSPGRVGPVTARAEVLARGDWEAVVRIELNDDGLDGRQVALATATVRK